MALTEAQLIAYLSETLEVEDELSSETALFSSGLLDSVLMMNLIMFLEEKERRQVNPEDVTLENFDTPASIMAYIEKLR